MEYSEEFKKVVDYCTTNNLFLGIGNTKANILIIGKEVSNPLTENDRDKNEKIFCKRNLDPWNKNIENNTENHVNGPLLREGFGVKNKNSKSTNRGTSRTWYNYQKLYNVIQNRDAKYADAGIDFHEGCFISEFSQMPLKYSKDVEDKKKQENIKKRIELFKQPFFQNFQVIIISAGHYPKKFGINLEEIFGIKWEGETNFIGRNWYNINSSENKILIHTNQLSMNIKNELIEEIGKKINHFKQEKNIKIHIEPKK